MLARLTQTLSRPHTPSRGLAAATSKSTLAKPRTFDKRIPSPYASASRLSRLPAYRNYCSKTVEEDDDVDTTIPSPDNPRLTHKEAVNMLEQNGLVRCSKAFEVFSTTDPAVFKFTDPNSGFSQTATEADEETLSKREEDELFMDNWLHSALTVIGVASVMDDILKPGSTVLDLACGNGYMTVILAKMVSPGGRVIGVDHSIEKLEAAQHTIGVHYPELIPVVRLLEGDVFTDFPKDKKFDAIHVAGAVQEVPQEWLRLIRTGGCLIAATPEIEPESGETQFMLRKYHVNNDGSVIPVNMMFVNYEELVEPKL